MIGLLVDNCREFLQRRSSRPHTLFSMGEEAMTALLPNGRKKGQAAEDISVHIPELIDSLRNTTGKTENHFFKLGEDLQTIHREASGLAQQIVEAIRIIEADDGSGIVQELGPLVNKNLVQLSGCQRETENKKDILQAIAREVSGLEQQCGGAQKMATYLTVIGFNMRIESAQRETFDKLFGVIAEEIRKSSAKILDIITRIENDARSLCQDEQRVSRQITVDLLSLKKLADKADHVVKEAFRRIEELLSLAFVEMAKAREYSDNLTRRIGEIVMGIQLHDSLSQRIEHIVEAIKDIDGLLDGASAGKISGHSIDNAVEIITLQIAQLENMADEVNGVHANTEKAFCSIRECMEDLIGSLQGFGLRERTEADLTQQGNSDPFASLTKALKELDEILKSGESLIAGIDSSAARSAAAAEQLNRYLQQIQDISFQTRLIGLNSIVNAAHLGNEGQIFEVLSNQLTGISEYSDNFVGAVEKIVGSIQSHLEKAEQQKDHATGSNFEHSFSIGQVIEHSSKRYAHFHTLTFSAGAKAKQLGKKLFMVQEELGFLDSLQEDLQALKGKAETMREILLPIASPEKRNRRSSHRLLTERYTMKRERDIHRNILALSVSESTDDSAADREADKVELFFDNNCLEDRKKAPDIPEGGPLTAEEDLNGDNIELF
jgi:hypothetical protein